MVEKKNTKPVVVLLNGNYPNSKLPLSFISNSNTIICADGAVNNAIKNNINPDYIIGDMDSIDKNYLFNKKIIKDKNQNTTDLEKILNWCILNKIQDIILLGFSGKMEDHFLGNFYIISYYSKKINIKIITDYFTILHLEKFKTIKCKAKSRISIVKALNNPIISTHGLLYEIKKTTLDLPSHGISNQAINNSFSINIKNGSVFLFIAN